jgi:virginiamycin A acetyltransferase
MRRLVIAIHHRWQALRERLFYARLKSRGVSIAPYCRIALGSRVSKRTSFGYGTTVAGPSVFKGSEEIVIGRYCAIGDGVRMISSNHRTDVTNMQYRLQRRLGFEESEASRGPIRVGNNVWIGDAVILLDGVSVGNGAVIAAGSVVTKDVDPFAIVAGVPAREIRKRISPEQAKRLSELGWWDWSEDEMRAHPELFTERLS